MLEKKNVLEMGIVSRISNPDNPPDKDLCKECPIYIPYENDGVREADNCVKWLCNDKACYYEK